ncbi:MAG: FlgD immunoglobulin-like domain containing protein, partial [Candidatus Zixiibacteriota bacterium]
SKIDMSYKANSERVPARGTPTNPAQIEIFTITGNLINRLPVEQNSRQFLTKWDGTDYNGQVMPSGVYMVSLNAFGFRYLKRVSLVR